MIGVELPETTIQDVEVLIRKVLSDLIDVLFCGHSEEDVLQIRSLEVSVGYPSVIIHVDLVKNTHNHCVRVAVLKFWCRLQKFKARMRFQQLFHNRLEIFLHHRICIRFRYYFEDATGHINALEVFFPEQHKHWLRNFSSLRLIDTVEKKIFQEFRETANFSGDLLEGVPLKFDLFSEYFVNEFFRLFDLIPICLLTLGKMEAGDIGLFVWLLLHLLRLSLQWLLLRLKCSDWSRWLLVSTGSSLSS